MKAPEFDRDGYPTETTLLEIENWEIDSPASIINLIEYLETAWSDYGTVEYDDGCYKFITGGWSGNESLIEALRNNNIAWSILWLYSHRNGTHIFSTTYDDD